MKAISELQPRRAPEPNRPFANREAETRLVDGKARLGVQGKPIRSAVICFWGAFGIGKSWLLRQLALRYSYGRPEGEGTNPTMTARMDLDRKSSPALWIGEADDKKAKLDREQLIRELWKQMADQLGAKIPALERASAEKWATEFVEEVTLWSTRKATPMILLDTVDDLVKYDEEAFFWLEQHLVEPLAMTDRVLFIFASRGELRRWNRFQVRRRVHSHRLIAFDIGSACEEVGGVSPTVGRALYRHSFGHPLVTDFLATMLEESKNVNLGGLGDKGLHIDRELVKGILRKVVAEILGDVPASLANLSRCASVLRWVGIEPLRFLAERLELVEHGRGEGFYSDELIGGMQSHHLLYWDSDKSSYETDRVLRRLLMHDLELSEQEKFHKAHLAAFDFHRHHLAQYPQYLHRYVPELAYHRAILADRGSPGPEPPNLEEWWNQFLSQSAPTHVDPWQELANALEGDEELREILPAKTFKMLLLEAQSRAAKAEQS